MKLFMFYVGGSFLNSNVELHDVRFSVGETAEACHDDLRRQWWGNPSSLHLDCWGAVEQADGYDVTLAEKAGAEEAGAESAGTKQDETPGGPRLFFVNLGGYDPREFAELHRNVLLVAADEATAKRKAVELIKGWMLPHKDNLYEVEGLVDVSAAAAAASGRRLHLTPASAEKPFEFICTYLPIG
ncbi:DUF1543 domain-containing protein [Radicibacter daui]|uniref:DUF1543 domain-containing protein n=1 Tax=Radicibacter daui TaxID=3064829 RepID=UPI004046C98B